jgi:serine/threonine-protein kinase
MIASRQKASGRVVLAAGVLVAILSAARPALAGDGAAAAEVLFSEGKRLAQEGNYAAACPKFEESQRLDAGSGTLYRLGDCYVHLGRTASAWAAFTEVAAASKAANQTARYEDAKKRADDLVPILPKLVIRVADANRSLSDLTVKRGNVVVGPGQWGSPLPVDPGEVSVEASASGRTTWHGVVTAKSGAASEIEVPVLDIDTSPEAAVAAPGAEPSAPAHAEGPPPPSGLGGQRTLAIVAGAAGLVGLGLGSAFGLVSSSRKSDADKHCDANNACDDEGLGLRHDAIKAGNIATIGFVAGGVLAATGIVLWITAPRRAATATAPSAAAPRAAGLRAAVVPRWGGVTLRMEVP